MSVIHIGIDFGGTKVEAAALNGAGKFLTRTRTANPGNYECAIRTIREMIAAIRAEHGSACTIGIGVPGSISITTGKMRNANSTYLNGRPFQEDLCKALGQYVHLANDANCLAMSESFDGAAAGAHIAAAVILGTGCGGGLVVDCQLIEGRNGIAGEWGHLSLPFPTSEEAPGPQCWCGKRGCLETWISGTGFQRDFQDSCGIAITCEEIIERFREGDDAAVAAFERWLDRLARGLTAICGVIDPDVVVLGGGLSNIEEIYERLPKLVPKYLFADAWTTRVVKAKWGDSSGVRGAARLWSSANIPHGEMKDLEKENVGNS
jgi:fructokinase